MAVGAVICGGVGVADHVLVGANATVIQGINVGSNCIIAAGAVVRKDLEDNVTYYE